MRTTAAPPCRSLPELEAEAAQLRAAIDQAEADWRAVWGDKAITLTRTGDIDVQRLRDRLQVVEMLIARMEQRRS